jgi:hypothetical protein
MINDETRQRFLTAINERVTSAGASIDEAHVFQSMKQGIMETGVAVVAASMTSAVEGATLHDRRVVYTARYRLTLKGPDRGKWEFSVHPEADAPLVTVDKVVSGVQKRSGDSMEPTKLSGEEIRMSIPEPQSQASSA